MENDTVSSGNTTPSTEEKTFTQEQVNAIVQERLSRDRAKYDAEKAALETRASIAEKTLIAHRNAVSEDYLDKYIKLAELYPNDENDFDKSLKAALADFPAPKAQMPHYVGPSGYSTNAPAHDAIREGMGLNRKE